MDVSMRNSFTPQSVHDHESTSGSIDGDTDTRASYPNDEDEGATVLDPKDSERQYWLEIRTKIEREIWRPGDGDGDRATDYFGKVDPPRHTKDRWKFYQLSLGPIKHEHNEPPKYVFLDDRAAYEIIQSNGPRAALGKFWPHDFGQSGKIRDRRPHRGRGSIGDPDAAGNDQYDFSYVGVKNARYYFTGEKDYAAVIYRSPELQAEIAKNLEKKRKGRAVRNREGDSKTRGHNQFTPRDWMVKNGARSSGKSQKKRKKTLADHKVPDWLLDRPRHSDQSLHAQAPEQDSGSIATSQQQTAFLQWDNENDDSHDSLAKRRRLRDGGEHVRVASDLPAQHSSSPSQIFPFHRQNMEHQNDRSSAWDQSNKILSSEYHTGTVHGRAPHEETDCPYVSSRIWASQLEKDLAVARDTISEQTGKMEKLEWANTKKQSVIDDLRKEMQDLRWTVGR